jgi:hypothetical protein
MLCSCFSDDQGLDSGRLVQDRAGVVSRSLAAGLGTLVLVSKNSLGGV